MRRLWLRWPSMTAILLFLLDVDYVVMPVVTGFGVHGVPLFLISTHWATGEVVYWNWYSKWLVRNAKHTDRYRRMAGAFNRHGLQGQFAFAVQNSRAFLADFWDWFVQRSLEHGHGGVPADNGMFRNADRFIRGTHTVMTYPLMIGLGLCPKGWVVAITLQRLRPVPGAFIFFLVANALKTYFLGRVYLWLPLWAKIAMVTFAICLVVWSVRKAATKVRTITTA